MDSSLVGGDQGEERGGMRDDCRSVETGEMWLVREDFRGQEEER